MSVLLTCSAPLPLCAALCTAVQLPTCPTLAGQPCGSTVRLDPIPCQGCQHYMCRSRPTWATEAGRAGAGAAGACSNRLSSTLLAILVTPRPPPLPFLAGGFLGAGFLGAAPRPHTLSWGFMFRHQHW